MKRLIILIIILTHISCRGNDTPLNIIKRHIGETIIFDHTCLVYHYKDKTYLTFNELRSKFDYLSVVYIDETCSACRATLIEWFDQQNVIEDIQNNYSYGVLFIYRGDNMINYIKTNLGMNNVFPYYIMNYQEMTFLLDNKLDQQVISSSFVIDKDNKICIIGEPFATKKLHQLYIDMFN